MTSEWRKRFWSHVQKQTFVSSPYVTTPCWVWTGKGDTAGYCNVYLADGKHVAVHRASYEMRKGPISPGVHILHRCDNPPCVRFGHLFPGNAKINAQDKVAKGRHGSSRLEVRAKMSALHKGRVPSKTTRAKIGAAHKGKIVSAETRVKLSLAAKGRPLTEEWRAKIADGKRQWWASKKSKKESLDV